MPDPLAFPPPPGPPVTAAECVYCRGIADGADLVRAVHLGVAYTAEDLHQATVEGMLNPTALNHLTTLRILEWLAAAGRLTPLPVVRSLDRPDGSPRVIVPMLHTALDECRAVGDGPHGDWCRRVLDELGEGAATEPIRPLPPSGEPAANGGGVAAQDTDRGVEPAQTVSAGPAVRQPGVGPTVYGIRGHRRMSATEAEQARRLNAAGPPPDDRPPFVLDEVERDESNRRGLWPTDQSG